ncbi:MAG: hypothetical protein OEY89_06520 [Gammaproteobacteria bacterium]|nr:hypothetical protein [Gammaproteobacteria bacterium]
MRDANNYIVFLLLVASLSSTATSADNSEQSRPFYRHLIYLKESGQQEKILPTVVKYETQGLLKNETINARLVLARSYQDMGVYLKSASILEDLIAAKVLKGAVLDEAFFYLAKNYFYQKKYADAENVIKKTGGISDRGLRSERDHLFTLIFLAQGKYQETQDFLRDNWRNVLSVWGMYSKFNLAVAMLKSGKIDQGMTLLKDAGSRQGKTLEELTLLDKINQVMGYLLIRENRPDQSRQYFEKVRLQGGYSNLALLGAGWASYMLKQYNQALVPWEELIGRDIRDVSVQEAMLMVPGVYEKIGRHDVAAERFKVAIDYFQEEFDRLDRSMALIKNNELSAIIKKTVYTGERDMNVLLNLSSPGVSHYLRQLNEDKGFSKLLTDYWGLQSLSYELNNNLVMVNSLEPSMTSIKNNTGVNVPTKSSLIQRSSTLKQEIDNALELAAQSLNQSALHLLEARKKHLSEYLIQARLSLVRIYEQLEKSTQNG